MSFIASSWARAQLPNLKKGCGKLVLSNLAERADNEGLAWPGVDRIAFDIGMTARSVQRGLLILQEMGLVRIEPRPNLTSHYFLNLKFSLAGVGDKKSPQNKKGEQGVTKSQARGDKKSPLEVTKSHPNQSLNQSLKQQQVVVVFEKLIWEKPLEANQKTACEYLLASAALPLEICQKFADEMSGQGRREPIRNPAGWLKNMIGRYGQKGFSFAHADLVAAARVARAAQAARESLVLPPARLAGAPAPAPRELTAVGRAELLASRALLKLPLRPSFPNGGEASTSGVTSANTGATSTPAAATP